MEEHTTDAVEIVQRVRDILWKDGPDTEWTPETTEAIARAVGGPVPQPPRLTQAAHEILKILWGDPGACEWWATAERDTFVVEIGGVMYRIKVTELSAAECPNFSVSEWEEGTMPHPFGYRGPRR